MLARAGTVGILGAGHLGRALAHALLAAGLPQGRLLLAHGGSAVTAARLAREGLSPCVVDAATLASLADTVLLTLRPQQAGALRGLPWRAGARVLSCMAGVPAQALAALTDRAVVRVMPSAPDTLAAGRAVAGLWPHDEFANDLLAAVGVEVHPLEREDDLNAFTAAVCLPAALAQGGDGPEAPAALQTLAGGQSLFAALYPWARAALPPTVGERERFVAAMATPGGVTEAIVTAQRGGASLGEALLAGVARSRELGAAIGRLLAEDGTEL